MVGQPIFSEDDCKGKPKDDLAKTGTHEGAKEEEGEVGGCPELHPSTAGHSATAHLGYLSIRTNKAFSLISFDVFA